MRFSKEREMRPTRWEGGLRTLGGHPLARPLLSYTLSITNHPKLHGLRQAFYFIIIFLMNVDLFFFLTFL